MPRSYKGHTDMRSKLFVPGSRPELFHKALSGPADGLSFDLEDAVRPERKAQARSELGSFLRSDDAATSEKTLIVRVNGLESAHFLADLDAVVCRRIDIINIPKAESAEDVRYAVRCIQQAEQRCGREETGAPAIQILVNIETPRALRIAHELGGAHPRVYGLQLGLGDLFEPYAIDRRQSVAVQGAMFQVAMAAHENGVRVFDGAFANVSDKAGFRAEALLAKSLGFHGKSCIHPSQVETVNEVFRPTQAEIEFSLKVVQAEAQAKESAVGAFLVEGRMIDAPFVERANNILKMAKHLGLIKP